MNTSANFERLCDEALTLKQSILKEIAQCHEKLENLKRQLSDIEGFLRTADRMQPKDLPRSSPSPTPRRPERRSASKRELVETAVRDVLASQVVANTSTLLSLLSARGIVVSGINPEGNLSAILSKSKSFVSSRPAGGWMLSPTDAHAEIPLININDLY